METHDQHQGAEKIQMNVRNRTTSNRITANIPPAVARINKTQKARETC